MKKPILGIIAVCLMQVAFVAYNAIDLPLDRSAVSPVREVALAPAQVAATNDDIVVFRSGAPVSEKPQVERTISPTLAVLKSVPRPAAKPEPVRPRMIVAARRPEIRTEYPIAPLEYNGSKKALSASVVTKETKKRSFFSRALPVLKKPYDWAKSFAGKFN